MKIRVTPARWRPNSSPARQNEGDRAMGAVWMWASAKWAAFSAWCDQPATNGLILTVAALMLVLLIVQRP